jgi:Zn-dependent protease
MNTEIIEKLLIGLPLFIIAGSIHEFFHGYSAYLLGDNTAKNSGRLTLNPVSHIDLVGTLLLPIIALFNQLAVFGWMKPVPINPFNFKNPSRDQAITAFAGPFSNFLQASLGFLLLKFWLIIKISFGLPDGIGVSIDYFIKILLVYSQINIFLLFFNLLPIPPLDGSWILRFFLPERLKKSYDMFYQFSFIILIVFIATGLFGKILYPVILLLNFIENLAYGENFNIIYFLIPSIAGVIVVALYYFKFRDNRFVKPFVPETDVKKEIINQFQKVKNENSIYKEILDKFQNDFSLSDQDKEFLKANEDFNNLCGESDFKENDEYCQTCEKYKNCITRAIQKKILNN